jgi:hypothetical protein
MFQPIPLGTGLRILYIKGKQAGPGLCQLIQGKLDTRTQRRHTKNRVSSRSAGLSYPWIRCDS